MRKILSTKFFERPVVKVAEDLIGKYLVREIDGNIEKYLITETEAYDGPGDLACHASKGRTKRTEVMFGPAGVWYIYLIYGMYSMINVVTGKIDQPAAVLIRGVKGISGPGRLSKKLKVDRSFTGKKLTTATGLWIEETKENNQKTNYKKILKTPRIGIDYSGPIWSKKLWRFVLEE
jgi:DNA-3-methyladenine glycosylase